MRIATGQIEITNRIADYPIPEGFSGLMLLLTYDGNPVGDLHIETKERMVSAERLKNKIAQHCSEPISRSWLSARIQKAAIERIARPTNVDVIIPTSDRPNDLERCLVSLAKERYRSKRVIVVDNGTNPGATLDTAYRHNAVYVREKRRGLDFARNAGIEASESEVVAFTDDDVVVDDRWVESIVDAFAYDPAIACVTGLTMPLELETQAQQLFETYCDGGLRRGYSRRIFDRSNLKPVASVRVGAGANMAFRTCVLRKVGLFDTALDCGTPARAGGDADMFYRLLRSGYKICYEPRALAWHRHRRGMHELHNQLAGYSTAVYAFLTKCLLEYGDFSAIPVGIDWFRQHHIGNLIRHLMRKGNIPLGMTTGEINGALCGPYAYIKSKAYASRIALAEGHERRGLAAGKEGLNSQPSLVLLASSILSRVKGINVRRNR